MGSCSRACVVVLALLLAEKGWTSVVQPRRGDAACWNAFSPRQARHLSVYHGGAVEGYGGIAGDRTDIDAEGLRLRGGMLCFGNDVREDGEDGFRAFPSGAPVATTTPVKEGWLLKKGHSQLGTWSRVHCVLGEDGFLTYCQEGKRSKRPGIIPLVGCSVFLEGSRGCFMSIGTALRISVSAKGFSEARARGKGCSGHAEYIFAALDEQHAREWAFAIEDIAQQSGKGQGLQDLDVKSCSKWLSGQMVEIKRRLGHVHVDVENLVRKMQENLVDGEALCRLTSEDLKEMGVNKIGVRLHILRTIAEAKKKGKTLLRSEEAPAHNASGILPEGSGMKKSSAPPPKSTSATMIDRIMRSFVHVPADGDKGVPEVDQDPNKDALDALVGAAQAFYGVPEETDEMNSTQTREAQAHSNVSAGAGAGVGVGDGDVGGSGNVTSANVTGDVVVKPVEGWLMKKSGYFWPKWRKRWFILEFTGPQGPRLRYLRTDSHSSGSNVYRQAGHVYTVNIPLRGSGVAAREGAREFTIKLPSNAKARHRSYTLQAATLEAQREWVHGITTASVKK